MEKHTENKGVVVLILIIIAAFALPWKNISWGKIKLQEETIVVTGESKTEQKNQVASFNAGVNVINENKEIAVNEVNEKINQLVSSVKDFGIPEGDIQTQSATVYEQQQTDKTKKNYWVVNNTVEITLKDITKANALTDLLNKSGANNIYGPNFRIEDTADTEKSLYKSAMADAKERAELIANSSGRKLGKVINVVEGGSSTYTPVYKTLSSGIGGGADLSSGISTISKTLTVTFEFK
jgi:uncharacterized protein YggE